MSSWPALIFVLICCRFFGDVVGQTESKSPNIIIMLMDDMGWGDLGANGDITRETVELDRMASEGMLFTDFYTANPLCSPSRAALLTGRLPVRNGFYTDNVHARNSYTPQEIVGGIDDWELLLPEVLAERGYRNKIVGKWHLGHQERYLPLKHGFHESFGSTNCHFGPYNNVDTPNIAFFRDDRMIGRYFEEVAIDKQRHLSNLSQLYTEEALDFIRKHSANDSKPFFLYWTPDTLHAPTYRSADFVGRSRKQSSYGDALIEIDDGVGRILELIRSTPNLAKNTFVFFTSDNGAALVSKVDAGSNGPLLCGKQTTFEGGLREPGIAWWPGTIPEKSVSQQPATVMDFFRTVVNLVGAKMPTDRVYDSHDLAATLFNNSYEDRSVFFYRGNQLMAVRHGHYKAHFWTYANSAAEFKVNVVFVIGFCVSCGFKHD